MSSGSNPNSSQNIQGQNLGGAAQGLAGSFDAMIQNYVQIQNDVTTQMNTLNQKKNLNPGDYLQMQMQMSRLSQISESISTYMTTIQSMLSNIIQKFRPR